MLKNANKTKWLYYILILIPLLLLFWVRFQYGSSFARSFDTVDFALGVERFDLLEMRPHFPGYPFFILGGMFINIFVDDPALALSTWNALLSVSTVIPMWFLFRRYLSLWLTLSAIVLCQSLPFLNIIISSPLSEGMAFSVLWWYLWSLVRAMEQKRWTSDVIVALIFSVLLGVRLSYLPVGIGLVLLWYRRWKETNVVYVMVQISAALLFQLIWVGALIQSVGGLESFIFISVEFIKGHFTGWGGAVGTTDISMFSRLKTLLFTNFLWVGISAKSFSLLLLWGGALLIATKTRVMNYHSNRSLWIWLIGSYGVWVFFAQNVAKPRHILPLVVLIILVAVLYIFRRWNKGVALLLIILMIGNAISSVYYMKKQATELPATYQLTYFVKQLNEDAVVYTWEEERVLHYLNVQKDVKKIKTYSLFLEEAEYKQSLGKEVYLTDHVLKGFHTQGYEVTNVEKVEEFQSDSLFDPVYHSITLYRWVGEEVIEPQPGK